MKEMKAPKSTPDKKVCKDDSLSETARQPKNQGEKEPDEQKKGRKKHSSAMVAAAAARSAVAQVKPGSYRDVDYMHTGTNVSYHEEQEGG